MSQGKGENKMGREASALVLCAVLLVLTLPCSADVVVPPLKSRVTDLTGTLSSQQREALEMTLSAFERRKGAQIAVLLVPTVRPETVEQFAIRVFEQWKLGRRGVDDGVLLLVAKNDRKLRIEVGYGLEGAINDATAKRIIEQEITPRFKEGAFYAGISAGTNRLIRVIEGEPLPAARSTGPNVDGSAITGPNMDGGVIMLAIFTLMAGVTLGVFLQGLFGTLLGSGIAGLIAGAVLTGFAPLLWALVVGVLVSLILATELLRGSGYDGSTSGSPDAGGGWSGDYAGGFGGGGGDSGGGGASGSW